MFRRNIMRMYRKTAAVLLYCSVHWVMGPNGHSQELFLFIRRLVIKIAKQGMTILILRLNLTSGCCSGNQAVRIFIPSKAFRRTFWVPKCFHGDARFCPFIWFSLKKG